MNKQNKALFHLFCLCSINVLLFRYPVPWHSLDSKTAHVQYIRKRNVRPEVGLELLTVATFDQQFRFCMCSTVV